MALESESQKKSYCVFGDVYGVMMFCFLFSNCFDFLVGCVCLPRNRRNIMIFHFFCLCFLLGCVWFLRKLMKGKEREVIYFSLIFLMGSVR